MLEKVTMIWNVVWKTYKLLALYLATRLHNTTFLTRTMTDIVEAFTVTLGG